jgi:hypothetical protein
MYEISRDGTDFRDGSYGKVIKKKKSTKVNFSYNFVEYVAKYMWNNYKFFAGKHCKAWSTNFYDHMNAEINPDVSQGLPSCQEIFDVDCAMDGQWATSMPVFSMRCLNRENFEISDPKSFESFIIGHKLHRGPNKKALQQEFQNKVSEFQNNQICFKKENELYKETERQLFKELLLDPSNPGNANPMSSVFEKDKFFNFALRFRKHLQKRQNYVHMYMYKRISLNLDLTNTNFFETVQFSKNAWDKIKKEANKNRARCASDTSLPKSDSNETNFVYYHIDFDHTDKTTSLTRRIINLDENIFTHEIEFFPPELYYQLLGQVHASLCVA